MLSLGAGPNGVVWVGYRFGGGIDRVRPKAGGVAIEKGVQRRGSDGLIYFLEVRPFGAVVGGHRARRGHLGWRPLEPLRHERWPGLGRLQPECIRRRARRNVFGSERAADSRVSGRLRRHAPDAPLDGCLHRACEWTHGCVRAPRSILWQPRELSHRKVFRAECVQSERSDLPLPVGWRNLKLD